MSRQSRPRTAGRHRAVRDASKTPIGAPTGKVSYPLGSMTPMTAHTHHALDYIEFPVTDLDAAKHFYTAAFGWQFNDYGPAYAGIRGSGGEVGGLRLDAAARAPGGPLVLLYSDDLDRSATAVAAAGGTVTQGPYAFPGGRRFHFTDPSGNELGVWAEA